MESALLVELALLPLVDDEASAAPHDAEVDESAAGVLDQSGGLCAASKGARQRRKHEDGREQGEGGYTEIGR